MTYVKFKHTQTSEFHDADCMNAEYTVSINDSGTAQVKQDVADALVEKYDTITEHES